MKTTQTAVQTSVAFSLLLTMGLGCSSSNNLRKFNEADMGKELPADVVKKFEIKDVAATTPPPSPTPVPVVESKQKKVKKKKVKKEAATSPTATPATAVPPTRKVNPMPFAVGEKLNYDIRFVGVTAGTFNIELAEMKEVNHRNVYHIKALAKTVKLFELVYRVNDVVESFVDESGLYSHRFTMDLDESKQSRKVIELYDYDQKKSFYWNRIDHVEKGFREQKEQHDIALWSQDPLSALFYMRAAPLPTTPGTEFKYPVIVDGKPWEVGVTYTGTERVYGGGRYFEADTYQLQNSENGQVKNKDNKVWISKDEHRYILRIETKLRVGFFAVALDKIL